MAITYETLDGEILGETRGGVERDYIPDPLGSTAALIDSSQVKTDSFTYWPYGEERSRTGTTPTPFRFVGTLGYYRDDSGRTYVRARHLSTSYARWLSVDPLWPEESAYGYVGGMPLTIMDLSGQRPKQCQDYAGGKGEPPNEKDLRDCVEKCIVKAKFGTCLAQCLIEKGLRNLGGPQRNLACCLMASAQSKHTGWNPCDTRSPYYDHKACCNMNFCVCTLDTGRWKSQYKECRFDLIYVLCAQDASGAAGCDDPNYTGPYG